MALAAWPIAAVPYFANGSAFTYAPDPAFARSDYDAGPARMRRRFTDSTVQISFTITMEQLEFELFKSFYKYRIYEGAAWFCLPAFVGSDYIDSTARFVSPYTVVDVSSDHFAVTCKIEIRNIFILDDGTLYWVETYGTDDSTLGLLDTLCIIVNDFSGEPGYPWAVFGDLIYMFDSFDPIINNNTSEPGYPWACRNHS